MEKKLTVVLYDKTTGIGSENISKVDFNKSKDFSFRDFNDMDEMSYDKKPIVLEIGSAVKKYRFGLALIGLVFMFIFKNNDSFANSKNQEQISSAKIYFENRAESVMAKPVTRKEKQIISKDAEIKTNTIEAETGKIYYTPTTLNNKNSQYFSNLKKRGDVREMVKDYLNNFTHVAIQEQKQFNIPASVILGLALLNTEYGSSISAKNNHFSIQCHENTIPIGKGMLGQVVEEGKCFTTYKSVWTSFRANSKMIVESLKKYRDVKYDSYISIAKALEDASYFKTRSFQFTDLIDVIEYFKLTEYDK